MTKAEKIFKDTYFESLQHVRHWGLEFNPNGEAVGFSGLITQKPVSIRTCNDFRKFMDAESKRIDQTIKYGVRTEEEMQERRDALKMVSSTLDNQIKSIREFNDWLKQ